MDSVVQLVNRLQSVATKLGDNAATAKDGGLPSLWDLLPSIVVIGGQVSLHVAYEATSRSRQRLCSSTGVRAVCGKQQLTDSMRSCCKREVTGVFTDARFLGTSASMRSYCVPPFADCNSTPAKYNTKSSSREALRLLEFAHTQLYVSPVGD